MRIRFCGHIFKEDMLRENFRHRPTCPVCRHNIITTVTNPETSFLSSNQNSLGWFVHY